MQADILDDQEAMDALLLEEVRSWRLYPKRNLEGHYKMMMMHGTTKTFIYRQFPSLRDYMYQAHIF
jgi:hypothetical protein